MSDIVEQARNTDAGAFDSPAKYAAYLEGLCQDLADEVERLQKRIETLLDRIVDQEAELEAIDDERANAGIARR